ncbi:cytidylyltransferase domain-containing protein [Aeromonas media]|uniref:cytidylyltransferase domain-containing protein n=1 Tax=Aeromonas media TaxID=651 RepID=UPI00192014E9|nr:glycosyltransferase family protein [Aeromonas media]MBL0511323.1 glycosyltransferase family protein [Aeromonas media]
MILGILQARTNSSRLPGKVLKPLLGVPMLARQIERLKRSTRLDQLVVATSDQREDEAIAVLCTQLGVPCFRGPLDDVLQRFHLAAQAFGPSQIVRLTGDCPLADPTLIDELIELHLAGGYDYSSNGWEPSYPDGLDAEILSTATLDQLAKCAQSPSEREHVTYYIRQHEDQFKIGKLARQPSLAHLRWTVDEPADFTLVEQIYQRLYPSNPAFATDDILALLAREPALATLNTQHQRNEGLASSLAKENHS